MRSQSEWLAVLVACSVVPAVAERWAPVFAAEIKPGSFSLGNEELDDFLGQILVESAMLTRLVEGLSYSRPERICAVWPKRFATVADALPYVRNPEELANKVYGGRMGNVDPGDGWKFRGRGLLQVTGRDNYTAVGQALSLDLVKSPDMLAIPGIALRASVTWWEGNLPDAVMGDTQKVTRKVNGGTHGLAERQRLSQLADTVV